MKGGAETEDTPYIEMADVAVMPLDVQVLEAYARFVAHSLLQPKPLCYELNLHALLTEAYARFVAQRLLQPKPLCYELNLYALLTKPLCYC